MKNKFLLIFLFCHLPLQAMEIQESQIFKCLEKPRKASLFDTLPNEVILHITLFTLGASQTINNAIEDFKSIACFFFEKRRKQIFLTDGKFSETDVKIFHKAGWSAFLIGQKLNIEFSNDFKKQIINNLVEKYGYSKKEFNSWFKEKIKNLKNSDIMTNFGFLKFCNKALKPYVVTNASTQPKKIEKDLLFEILFLIYYGLNPNYQSSDGKTILMIASGLNNKQIVEFLIDIGADPNVQDWDAFTAYNFALANGYKDICTVLITAGALFSKKIACPALVKSAKIGNINEIQKLLELGADPNSYANEKAIAEAIIHKHTSIVQILLDAGANPDTRLNNGDTVLMKAVQLAQIETVNLLLKKNADTNLANPNGLTALTFCLKHKNKEIYKLLIKKANKKNRLTSCFFKLKH